MNILQKIASGFRKSFSMQGWQPLYDSITTDEEFARRPLRANEKVSWVYACVKFISSSIVSGNLRLYRIQPDGTWDEIVSDPVLDVLNSPNLYMSRTEMFFLIGSFLELTGEATLLKIKDMFGRTVGLQPLNPLSMELKLEGGWPSKWIYRSFKLNQPYETEYDYSDILQIKYPNPSNVFRGLSPISAIADATDTAYYVDKWQKNFFRNSAVPSAVIQAERTLSDAQFKRLKAEIDEKYRGVSNAHKVMLFENKLEFKPITMPMKDMQLLELKQFNRQEIAAIYGLPLAKLGIVEDVNRASAEQLDYTYAKDTLTPKLTLIAETLTKSLLRDNGIKDKVLFYDSVIPKNQMIETAKNTQYLDRGVLTINEVRDELGLQPVPWGDEPFKKAEEGEKPKEDGKKVMA
ncbi:MAG: phage portal protein [Thermotogaceae bacterium]|nr:phage portal protein [Thermotogaceae bacterium]